MGYQDTFQRHELKYLLSPQQKSAVFAAMKGHMEGGRFQNSSISNIYFDTPDFLLIRHSLEKPIYKEKLRMRSYGIAKPDTMVFVELKKKYKSVVYKRRISLPLSQTENSLLRDGPGSLGRRGHTYSPSGVGLPPAPPDVSGGAGQMENQTGAASQIIREIDYFREFYQNLRPALFLSYQREAFSGIEEPDLRITFDENILWRREQLSLAYGPYGAPLLPPGSSLMEIKTPGAMPLWLSHTLSAHGVYKVSFSKYGKAYGEILKLQLSHGEDLRHVS